MNNARGDRFATGAAEARGVEHMTIAELKQLPSGDAPGKTVGAILSAKRTARSHKQHVLTLKYGPPPEPVTIKAGVLVDGHHRVAAGEDAGLTHLPVRRTP